MSQIINVLEESWIKFFSDPKENLQVGVMLRPKGFIVKPHYHNDTQEVLYVIQGYVNVTIDGITQGVNEGHLIHLTSGVHSLEFICDSKILEVKQGPFKNDKVYV